MTLLATSAVKTLPEHATNAAPTPAESYRYGIGQSWWTETPDMSAGEKRALASAIRQWIVTGRAANDSQEQD
jgi:hypothetical protein